MSDGGGTIETSSARAPLLRALLRGISAATGVGVLVLGWSLAAQGRWTELGAGVAISLLYLALDLAPMPYPWRASALLLLWGAGATAMLLLTGITMGPAFAGFVLPFLAALLLGPRATVVALAWTAASLAAVGLLGQSGLVTAPPAPAEARLAYEHWPLLLAAQLIVVGPLCLVALRLVAGLERAVAERERLIADLRRAQAGLAETERMKALGLLAGGVVHDLNNSLTVLAGELQLTSGLTAESRATLDGMVQGLGRLTRQVLLSAGKVRAERQPVELHAALRPALAAIRHILPAQVELRVEAPSAPLPVVADPSLLQQTLLNLALNARDAMADGGLLQIRLARSERAGRPFAKVEVVDDGRGMDAATLARAGEPLFTTKPPGQGTGLGLSNVRATMQQHEGALELASEVGAGTRVTLWLPLTEASAETSPSSTQR